MHIIGLTRNSTDQNTHSIYVVYCRTTVPISTPNMFDNIKLKVLTLLVEIGKYQNVRGPTLN